MKNKKGYISTKYEGQITENFKGEVDDFLIKFPKELGVEHPFKFEDVEKVYRKMGIINGAINKFTDNIVGDFQIKCKNPNAQALLDSFIKDTDFATTTREWIREGLLKGNGFIELDLDTPKIRVLNANNMYVKRNRRGDVLGYNQYIGDKSKYSSKKIITFLPRQIAHLPINKISDEAYGLGIVWPNERVIENLITNEQDLHKLISRKAGAPLHVKIGMPGESVSSEDIDDFASKLKYMNNRTEWPTDANVDMKVIDFGDIGKNLTDTLNYDMETLSFGMEVPIVLWGKGNIPEGLAKVQLEAFQRKIAAIQEEIEGIVEEKIFKPILNANSLDEDVEFIWNLPGETEINARIEKLNMILQNFNISENMKRLLQLEIANLLNIEHAEDYLLEPEVGLDEEKEELKDEQQQANIDATKAKSESPEAKKEAKIPQPEVPGAKPAAKECHIHENYDDMTMKEFVNLKEINGFNYTDYLIAILKRLKIDKFEDLQAITEKDLDDGLLSEHQINKLKTILKDGFRKNQTIRTIEKNIREGIGLKDRITETRIIPASERPMLISRTETVRLANMGLVDIFKENKVQEVRWLAALSDRTCPECEALNGRTFNINELAIGVSQPPLHPACRCSLISI